MTADIIRFPNARKARPRPLPRRAQVGINRRLQEIGQVLDLPPKEIAHAGADLDALIDFCKRTGQSMDWICLGNPRVMIAQLYRCR